MKTQAILYTVGISLLSLSLSAQKISKDSSTESEPAKESLEISGKINEDKTKLAKLENELAEKTRDVEKTTEAAQKSADNNKNAAAALIDNAQDKKLADQAKKAAREAARDSKEARKAADDQENIAKEIESLRKKIAENESKLGQVPATVATAQPANITKQTADSTQKLGFGEPVQTGSVKSNNIPQDLTRTENAGNNGSGETNNDQSKAAITNEVTQRVLESTYRNYPQQSAQPTIIINNIVIPSDYNRPKNTEMRTAPVQQYSGRDREDYEDYKAWLRERGTQKGNSPAQSEYNSTSSQQKTESAETASGSSASKNRLTLKERFGELPARNSGMWLIPMVGVHASGFEANFKDNKAEGRTGWNAGLDFRFHMKRFFIQPGVHYFNSSVRFTSKDSLSDAPLLDGPRLHSLKVPVMLGVYLTKANSGFFKFNVKAGAVGNYVLAVDKSNVPQFSKNNIEDFSYGLNAGLGFEFGLITLDVSHEWGITDFFKDSNTKNNVLRLTLGIKSNLITE